MRDLTKFLALCSVLAVLLCASSALASTWTHRLGVKEGVTWTFTAGDAIPRSGYCNEAHTCKEYYWTTPALGQHNSHDGVHAQLKSSSNFNYWNMWYSKNDGASWVNTLDNEYLATAGGYYYYKGYEWTDYYPNWQAPGNCAKVSFMKIRYRVGTTGTIYERRFQVPSYYCIE